MQLTQHQQDMLDGKYGKGTAYAMKIQAAIGESFGAERMVPITRAHVALSNQEADLWICGENAGRRRKMPRDTYRQSGFLSGIFQKQGYGSTGVCGSDAENAQCLQSTGRTAFLQLYPLY